MASNQLALPPSTLLSNQGAGRYCCYWRDFPAAAAATGWMVCQSGGVRGQSDVTLLEQVATLAVATLAVAPPPQVSAEQMSLSRHRRLAGDTRRVKMARWLSPPP